METKSKLRLQHPPRPVSLSVQVANLVGSFNGQFGWLFFGFGLIFVWIFGLRSDTSFVYYMFGDVRQVPGYVLECSQTSYSEGGSDDEPGTPIYEIRYSFKDDLGGDHLAISYATGFWYEPGDRVRVEFPANRPHLSRIEGTRRDVFGILPLLITPIFPLIGLGFIAFQFRRGIKANRLLKHGQLGFGRLVSKEPTSVRVNNRPVYKLTFALLVREREYHVTAKSHQTAALEDDEQEAILYNPDRPEDAVLFDNLPGAATVDTVGDIRPRSLFSTLKVAVLPAVTTIGHGAFLFNKFF